MTGEPGTPRERDSPTERGHEPGCHHGVQGERDEHVELQPQSTSSDHQAIKIEPGMDDAESVGIVIGAIVETRRTDTAKPGKNRTMQSTDEVSGSDG